MPKADHAYTTCCAFLGGGSVQSATFKCGGGVRFPLAAGANLHQRPFRRSPHQPDIARAKLFLKNASSFAFGIKAAAASHPEIALQHAGIAIEISLKAFLLRRGFCDQWNRLNLGHNLVAALRLSDLFGLNISKRSHRKVFILSPFYSRHEIKVLVQDQETTKFILEGAGPAEEIITHVRTAIALSSGACMETPPC